jgi:rhamnulose-1-phosphate aldolase
MIKATSDAWLKGWDERNGGNLTLRLDAADIEPYEADFHAKPRYIALSHADAGEPAVYRHRFRQILP